MARRRLISFLPLSVTVRERPCGGVNCHFARRYGDLEARDSNFPSKNVRPRLVVGRFASGYAVYILLPANWKTLWRYQQTLDDNGRGLMFEPSDSLHPFLEETTLLLPSKRFQIFLLPPSRLFPIHGLTIKRIRSFFVSLERASRRRLGDTPNHPPTSYSFSRLSRVSPKVLPKFSSFLNSIHSPGGRRV